MSGKISSNFFSSISVLLFFSPKYGLALFNGLNPPNPSEEKEH